MCHHHDLHEWQSLREDIADTEPDELTDDREESTEEPERRKQAPPVPPADD